MCKGLQTSVIFLFFPYHGMSWCILCTSSEIKEALISGFNIEAVTTFTGFMSGSGMTTINYDATLIAWAAQNVQPNVIKRKQ